MDRIDSVSFLTWSAFLYGVAGFDGWWLLGWQAGWFAAYFIGRKLIDRWFGKTA